MNQYLFLLEVLKKILYDIMTFWIISWQCAVLCLVTQSCLTLWDPMDCSPPGSSVHGDSPGKNTGVGCHALLQGIFPTQGSNPGLLHCRWILSQLSHQGSPRILEWVAYLFSSRSSQPRNRIRVSCIAGRFFMNWAIRAAHRKTGLLQILQKIGGPFRVSSHRCLPPWLSTPFFQRRDALRGLWSYA